MATMIDNHRAWTRKAARLLSEPTIHFFIIAAVIFLVHRLIAGDPRTIVMSPALRNDLVRRFQDQLGKTPSVTEIDAALESWKRDEALYREALREGLDRDEPMVRTILINKERERAALGAPVPEPSESELDQYLAQHRDLYETPFVYEHEYVVFPKNGPEAEQQRAKYERALKAGATPATLGLRSVAANVRRERIEEEFGPELAKQICSLPIGEWQPLENEKSLILVRMIRIEGGPPNPELQHQRLVVGWKAEMQAKATERAAQAIEARYRFKEASK
jgi:hypothetical protein